MEVWPIIFQRQSRSGDRKQDLLQSRDSAHQWTECLARANQRRRQSGFNTRFGSSGTSNRRAELRQSLRRACLLALLRTSQAIHLTAQRDFGLSIIQDNLPRITRMYCARWALRSGQKEQQDHAELDLVERLS